jgi:T5SS/PEP-CTERM-associated repeat protein
MADSDTLPAGTKTYTGLGQSGNWSDPNNWGGVTAAGASNVALFQMSATENGSFTARQLMFLGTESITVNGALSSLSPGLCASFMVCDQATLTLKPTGSITSAGGLIVGNDSVGTLIAQGNSAAHSTLTSVSTKIGQNVGAVGTATIDGAVWNNSTNMFVGQNAAGTLSVLDGGRITVGTSFVVGANVGATGTVNLASGAQLSVASYAKIGGGDPTQAGGLGTVNVGANSSFSVAGPLKIASGSALNLTGGTVNVTDTVTGLKIWTGGTLSGFGTVTSLPTGIGDDGTIRATGGTLVLNGMVSGAGSLQIAANSTAQITASKLGLATVNFAGSNGTLALAHGVTSLAAITNFAAGDHITMAGIDSLSWNATKDILTLSSGGQVVDTLHILGTYASTDFTLTQGSAAATIGLVSHTSTSATHI